MTEQLAEEIFRTASESIDVLSPRVDEVAAEARDLRRRRRRIGVTSVAAAAVVLAGLTWVATRPGDPELPPGITRSPNPVDVAWYGSGEIHLDDVRVEVPAVTDLAEVAGGAVYGDRSGAIGFMAADGTRTPIGHKVAAAPLAASGEVGWAAWVDPRGDVPELVVYDVVAERILAKLELPSPGAGWQGLDAGSHPIAIDQGRVYYVTQDGDFSWAPPGGEPERLDQDGLVDVGAAVRVFQERGRIEMVQSFFSVSFARRGEGALISPGGNFVLSRVPRDLSPEEPFRVILYDARSGDRLPSGLGPHERVVDATFGRNHGVVYLAARAGRLRRGQDIHDDIPPLVVLRTCEPGGIECHDVAPLSGATDRPLLAH
jgi:hypothetical protein